jgi:catechol 2,3-dioxygenase-like lactoylglutathione lyase family enzyme
MMSDKNLKSFIPTIMPAKAKAFYRDILGLELLSEDEYALEFNANNVLLRVTTVPEFKPNEFTILGWNVPDIAALIRLMNSKGIIFEKYGFLNQDDWGIWTAPGGSKVAWFKDPDGNLLSLTQP